MEYFHWLAWASCLAMLPPRSRMPAEYEKLEKVLDFLATTIDVRIINILLIVNPKHSSY